MARSTATAITARDTSIGTTWAACSVRRTSTELTSATGGQPGVPAGLPRQQIDRRDRVPADFQRAFDFENGNFDYAGSYVPQSDYSYYFAKASNGVRRCLLEPRAITRCQWERLDSSDPDRHSGIDDDSLTDCSTTRGSGGAAGAFLFVAGRDHQAGDVWPCGQYGARLRRQEGSHSHPPHRRTDGDEATVGQTTRSQSEKELLAKRDRAHSTRPADDANGSVVSHPRAAIAAVVDRTNGRLRGFSLDRPVSISLAWGATWDWIAPRKAARAGAGR